MVCIELQYGIGGICAIFLEITGFCKIRKASLFCMLESGKFNVCTAHWRRINSTNAVVWLIVNFKNFSQLAQLNQLSEAIYYLHSARTLDFKVDPITVKIFTKAFPNFNIDVIVLKGKGEITV